MGELAAMLLIHKGNIALQVQCGAGAVWVQPAAGKTSSLLATLARNEELLAQGHLTLQDGHDTQELLANYFQQRGWVVKGPGGNR